METIDITQAIKDNATAVSNNLDVSVLEGLLPIATKSNKGLLQSNTFFQTTINSGETFNPGYLMLPSVNTGSNYAISFERAGNNGLILISSETNASANVPALCQILVIGKCDLLSEARYIKKSDGFYSIELTVNVDQYVKSINVFSFTVGGTSIGNISLSHTQSSDVTSEVQATIKRFSDI